MTDKWENIKHKIENLANSAADKATEFTRDAADKAEKLTQKSKIKLDIFQLEKSRDKQYLKLGKLVFNNLNHNFNDIMALEGTKDIKDTIDDLNSEIQKKEEKLTSIKTNKTEDSN